MNKALLLALNEHIYIQGLISREMKEKIAIMPESNYKDMTIYYIKQNILKRMNKCHKDS